MFCSMTPHMMSELCVQTISDAGARVDQLIYGVGAFVHDIVCVKQKRREQRYLC